MKEETRRATRDYSLLSSTPWGIWNTLYSRRSLRRFEPTVVPDDFAVAFERFIEKATSIRNAPSNSIFPVLDEVKVSSISRAAQKGLGNKLNVWLPRTHPAGFLVMRTSKGDRNSERPRELPFVSMAGEDCILWLTENGYGTCWLGAINAEAVSRILGLGEAVDIPLMIVFGKPEEKVRTVSYDKFTLRTLSRKRKPLREIAFLEDMSNHFVPVDFPERAFESAEKQDIESLLESMDSGSKYNAPLSLLLEACFEAARISPSAANFQQSRFVGISSLDGLENVQEACKTDEKLDAAIVACGKGGRFDERMYERPFWMIDVPIAISHITLVAASMRIRVAVYIESIDESSLKKQIAAQDNLRVAGVVGFMFE
ncbi:MAG: nitroreductase family protein [Actinomycetota bacterium]|nr:nitroreductase family protein [Actinomycetota bacterium]